MYTISFRDLLIDEELSHVKNEVSLLSPEHDDTVKRLLAQVGFDITQEITYEPSKHRDMKGNVAIGFMAVGEFSRDPSMRRFLDATDRIILAGEQDPSLGRELAGMAGRLNTYRNQDETESTRKKSNDPRYYSEEQLLEMGFTNGGDEEVDEPHSHLYIEKDYEENTRAIKNLRDVRDMIRGKGN